MLESRPDWCISRQRSWGLPIPTFINSKGDALLTKESAMAVAKYVGQKGSNCWFTDSPKEILGEDFQLPKGFSWDDLQKEENIFDVWFESGCSWHSVMEMAGYDVPVDLYLEGSDQHRGWFQLSLLPALGATGAPPFKTVLTHGFTVDDKGMKQSKSAGNYVSALEEVEKYGADILRLWVSSVNYQEDMRCSDELIGRLQDAYRKIRNTIRYLMSNINGFVPAEMSADYKDMMLIDQWAMEKLNVLIDEVHQAYDSFGFHRVFNKIYNFCTVEMSSLYMDVLKDRMYCDAADSMGRRSGQTAMYKILDALVRMLAPILAHTAEEAWAAIEYKSEDVDSVHLASMPVADISIDAPNGTRSWRCGMKCLRRWKVYAPNRSSTATRKHRLPSKPMTTTCWLQSTTWALKHSRLCASSAKSVSQSAILSRCLLTSVLMPNVSAAGTSIQVSGRTLKSPICASGVQALLLINTKKKADASKKRRPFIHYLVLKLFFAVTQLGLGKTRTDIYRISQISLFFAG
jgi:isoleucyl-tRNA synthetase